MEPPSWWYEPDEEEEDDSEYLEARGEYLADCEGGCQDSEIDCYYYS